MFSELCFVLSTLMKIKDSGQPFYFWLDPFQSSIIDLLMRKHEKQEENRFAGAQFILGFARLKKAPRSSIIFVSVSNGNNFSRRILPEIDSPNIVNNMHTASTR